MCGPDGGYVVFTSCDPEQRDWQCRCDDGTPEPEGWSQCWCETYKHQGCDCLLEGTLITLADGSTKAIETIQIGDKILGYDELSSKSSNVDVISVHAPYSVESHFVINKKIHVTEYHPILSNGDWVNATELKVGDVMQGENGFDVKIVSIQKVEERGTAYNIQVEGGTYIADGIVVHNKEDCEDFMPNP